MLDAVGSRGAAWALEKDTGPTDNREEGTGQRILGQFHISVEEKCGRNAPW
jgi:hypothetical protein